MSNPETIYDIEAILTFAPSAHPEGDQEFLNIPNFQLGTKKGTVSELTQIASELRPGTRLLKASICAAGESVDSTNLPFWFLDCKGKLWESA